MPVTSGGAPLVKVDRNDPPELISRELEYQIKRGKHPKTIVISPEVHERMRTLAGVGKNARLMTHDDVPVEVDMKLIGPKAWRILYEEMDVVPEKMVDARRSWDTGFEYGTESK